MIFAGILAGGTGSRMGAGRPKQFLELDGVPILVRTAEVFRGAGCFDRIYIAVTSGWEQYAADLISGAFGADSGIEIITGGSDRTGSILCVIDAIERGYASTGGLDDNMLVTHDAARNARTLYEVYQDILTGKQS